jgi:hypothetical protein
MITRRSVSISFAAALGLDHLARAGRDRFLEINSSIDRFVAAARAGMSWLFNRNG